MFKIKTIYEGPDFKIDKLLSMFFLVVDRGMNMSFDVGYEITEAEANQIINENDYVKRILNDDSRVFIEYDSFINEYGHEKSEGKKP